MAEDKDVTMGDVEEEEVEDLTNSDVVTKYRLASEIANKTLAGLVAFSKPGKRVIELCEFGDSLIKQQCEVVYKKDKKLEKGVAFPTCISVNDCVCHNCPLESEENIHVLKEGDLVKVDIGVHIDGYIAVAAHSLIVKAEGDSAPVTGRAADVMLAAYTAAEASVKLIKPGASNSVVTNAIKKVAEDFKVSSCQGVLMHQMKRFVIDGNEVVIQREEGDQKVEEFEFEASQVYTVDIVMSTGEGKPIQRESKTTVFKRAAEVKYQLKMKAARNVFAQLNRKFPALPFTLRSFDDERQARMGMVEVVRHELVTPYPVLWEKSGDLVAHFKYTVLLMPSGTSKITGLTINPEQFVTENKPSEEVKAILALSAKTKKKKKKKKKTGQQDAQNPPAAPMETD